MLTNLRMLGIAIVAGLCLIPVSAQAGIGVRGGVQVRGGTRGIVGGHVDLSAFPLLRLRPTVELSKKGNQTLINPSLDIHLKLNPTGIGPLPYIGAGGGVQIVRTKSTTLGVTTTSTSRNPSFNVGAGLDIPIAPFVRLFVEGKGVFVKKNRTVRIVGGLTLAL